MKEQRKSITKPTTHATVLGHAGARSIQRQNEEGFSAARKTRGRDDQLRSDGWANAVSQVPASPTKN